MLAVTLALVVGSGSSRSALGAAGLILDMAGALFLAGGLMIKRSKQWIAELSPRYGYNTELEISGGMQTADAQVGAFFLVLGFSGQLAANLGWEHASSWRAVIWATSIAVIIDGAGFFFLSRIWRPRKIRDIALARLIALDAGDWWPALAAYARPLGLESDGGITETIAAFGERVLGLGDGRVLQRTVNSPTCIRSCVEISQAPTNTTS